MATPDVRPVGDLPSEIGKTAARELSLNGIGSLKEVAAHCGRELLASHGAGPGGWRTLQLKRFRRREGPLPRDGVPQHLDGVEELPRPALLAEDGTAGPELAGFGVQDPGTEGEAGP